MYGTLLVNGSHGIMLSLTVKNYFRDFNTPQRNLWQSKLVEVAMLLVQALLWYSGGEIIKQCVIISHSQLLISPSFVRGLHF